MKDQLEQTLKGILNRLGQSVVIKLGLIGVLSLLLLIPSVWVQNLILERQDRQSEVTREITDKWSGSQLVQGPVMVLPLKTIIKTRDTTGNITLKESFTNIYILPETLNINGTADPEVLHRGIFDAVVYNSKIKVSGKFSSLELKESGIDPNMIQWDKAKVAIGLSDLKGLKSNPVIRIGNNQYNVEPDFNHLHLFKNNLIVQPDLGAQKSSALDFSFDLDLRGSSDLTFLHLGKTTTARIGGNWNDPSFIGRYLPDDRKIAEKEFSATWKLPYFTRPFPQQWTEENTKLETADDSSFGVKFILPVDQYQKTMRTAKYAILLIILSFISLFFTEILSKRRVHLLQYVLIGVAMIIYYTLLLSFSEQVGFNIAYLIASVVTVGLIGTFIAALLRNKKTALLFSGILTVFYSFVFVIIQLQDLALLFGSIGLFVVTACLMYLSARISRTKASLAEFG